VILSECVDMYEDMGSGGNARSNQEIYVFQEPHLLYGKASKGIAMNFWGGEWLRRDNPDRGAIAQGRCKAGIQGIPGTKARDVEPKRMAVY
jgi:hypothetical protein